MTIGKAFVVLVVFTVHSASAGENADNDPMVGTRVRATTASTRIVGRLVSQDENTLRIEMKPGQEASIQRRELTGLEQSRRPSLRKRGAFLGFLVGTASAFILAAASSSESQSTNPACDPSNPSFFCLDPLANDDSIEVGGALVLGGLGALLGAAVAPGERWTPVVAGRPVRLTVAPVRGRGVAFRVAIGF